MKTRLLLTLATLAAATTASAALVVDMNFDNSLSNAGTWGGTGSFVSSATYSADAGGVSGLSGDYALDNTAATGMGDLGTGGSVSLALPISTALSSMTVTGWYNTTTDNETNGRLAFVHNGTNFLFQIVFLADNQMRFQVANNTNGNGTADSSADTKFNSNGDWIFYSVVYDNPSDEVRFYAGSESTATSLVSTVTSFTAVNGITTRASGTETLYIGNTNAGTRPFDGSIENTRIYNEVLALSTLDSVRVSAIPEPGTLALVGIALGSLLVFRRRR